MKSPANPHDRFFKAVFSREDVAADFLRHHLPADIASLLLPGTLAIRKDSFVDQEECVALVTRLLRRKFGIHPELGPLLVRLPTLPVEKLEDLAEAIIDWAEVSELTEWVKYNDTQA